MDDLRFKDGQEIQGVFWENGDSLSIGQHADRIVVVMEYGQMARVPWFVAYKDNRPFAKYNAALVSSVAL